MGKSKIVLADGRVLMDLTSDTVKKDKLLKGYTAHGADGELITGECEYDANTQDATATEAEILATKTAYNKGKKVVGTMPNVGAETIEISSLKEESISYGYHDGSGKVKISDTEKEKIKPENIRSGVRILGVEGTMTGTEGEKGQKKETTPSFNEQNILPDAGYTCLTEVVVKAIPYVETPNSAGGITVTIG